MKEELAIGIDFGGTKIKTAVIAESGHIVGKPVVLPTAATRPAKEIIASMVKTIDEALANSSRKIHDMVGIGIGSPGPLDLQNGIILNTPNLPTLHNFPLKGTLADHFKIPTVVNNDANCFVLGETYWGAGKNMNIVCGVTLGTGFGCGIVIDRKIFSGATGTAAEIWNSPYLNENFEEYGAARGVVNAYQKLAGQELKSVRIFELAQQNDETALLAWQEYGRHLGKLIAIMVNLLDPAVFVIGGSVSNAWEFFSESMVENLHNHINPLPIEHLKLEKARLGNDAGVLGAAAQIFR